MNAPKAVIRPARAAPATGSPQAPRVVQQQFVAQVPVAVMPQPQERVVMREQSAFDYPSDMQLATTGKDHDISVTACGQNITVDAASSGSLFAVQAVLQRDLAMQGQTFDFFDIHGNHLSTDGDLQSAVAAGNTPLAATLSDSSIHFIENRREELSQMAWKLMRDRVGGLAEQVQALSRKVDEMNESQKNHKSEVEGANNRMRHEMIGLCDNYKDVANQDVRTLSERVDAVAHIIHSERNAREAVKQGLEQQIQGVRDAVESDRSLRRSESQSSNSLVEECQKALMQEARSREVFEDRHSYDITRMSERIEALSRMQADKAQDLAEQIRHMTRPISKEMEEQNRQVLQVKSVNEGIQIEVQARFQKSDDQLEQVEGRVSEILVRQTKQMDEVWTKLQKMVTTIEQVRLEERGTGLSVKNMLGRMEEMEESQKTIEDVVALPDSMRQPAPHAPQPQRPQPPQALMIEASPPPPSLRQLPLAAPTVPVQPQRAMSPAPATTATVMQMPSPGGVQYAGGSMTLSHQPPLARRR